MTIRIHTVGTDRTAGDRIFRSGHMIQRIVGLPLSWTLPMPAANCLDDVAPGDRRGTLLFDEPVWEDDRVDERTPLDLPVPDGITQDDYALPEQPSDYDGFDSRDTMAPKLPHGRHSQPQELDTSDLERMADQILAADDAGQLRTIKPMRVPGLPPVDERDWRYLPYTYTLGWKDCPRCDGTGDTLGRFGKTSTTSCNYCSGNAGWQITRTRMTPWHPQHGWAKRPPRVKRDADGKLIFAKDGSLIPLPIHTSHWRTRAAAYTGNVRIKERTPGEPRPKPSDAVYQEIRRRHFAYVTRRQLSALVTKETRQLIAA